MTTLLSSKILLTFNFYENVGVSVLKILLAGLRSSLITRSFDWLIVFFYFAKPPRS